MAVDDTNFYEEVEKLLNEIGDKDAHATALKQLANDLEENFVLLVNMYVQKGIHDTSMRKNILCWLKGYRAGMLNVLRA